VAARHRGRRPGEGRPTSSAGSCSTTAAPTNLSTNATPPPYLSKDDPVRVGDTVESFGRPVLAFGFSEWRLQPTIPVDADTRAAARTTFKDTNPRTAAAGERRW
jgi:hypothetical protein